MNAITKLFHDENGEGTTLWEAWSKEEADSFQLSMGDETETYTLEEGRLLITTEDAQITLYEDPLFFYRFITIVIDQPHSKNATLTIGPWAYPITLQDEGSHYRIGARSHT